VFWYIRNVEDDGRTLFGEYRAREDFKRRDAPRLEAGAHMIYRNGDIRAHVLAWKEIDSSLGRLLELPEFHSLSTVQDYVLGNFQDADDRTILRDILYHLNYWRTH
jgi:hypothetical protein